MKKNILILIFAVSFCWIPAYSNVSTYGISIGKNEIFRQTVGSKEKSFKVSKKLFVETDTLFAYYYQCGGDPGGAFVSISIMNQAGEVLKGEEIPQTIFEYYAFEPIRNILSVWKLNEITRLSITLSIRENEHALARTYKIADLELVD